MFFIYVLSLRKLLKDMFWLVAGVNQKIKPKRKTWRSREEKSQPRSKRKGNLKTISLSSLVSGEP